LSADDTNYVKAVTRKTLVAAVARIYHPGTKFDTVLVLDGDQGIGKSTMWKSLAGDEYFSDALSLTDMDDKSGAEKLQGFWIIEIGELAGMKRADIEKVKSFMSTSDDKYRPSYGKVVESHPRQCIVVATVNGERGYLRDITGNRRFWIVKCRQIEKMVKWKISPEERDQIWAEVKYYYEQGEKLYLEGNLLEEAEEAQRGAMEADERQGMVEEYLSKLLPENWAMMDLYQRRNFLDGDDLIQKEGTVTRQTVSNAEIWCECFKRNLADMKPTDSYAIVALMTQVDGWERTSRRMRIPIYGQQRMYVNMAQNTRNL
jgi:predicted P-loop ATPase